MQASISTNLELNINGTDFDVLLKSNYSATNPLRNEMVVEISTSNTAGADLAVYLMPNENGADLYLQFANNKVMLSLNSSLALFPLSGTIDEGFISIIAGVLQTRTPPKYQFRRTYHGTQTLYSRHYYLEIDSKHAIGAIATFANSTENRAEFEEIFQNLLGVSLTAAAQGNLPESSLILEFKTERGLANNYSNGVITWLDFSLRVEPSLNTNTIFKGEAFSLDLVLKEIDIRTGVNPLLEIVVPNINAFNDFWQTSFSLSLPIVYASSPFNNGDTLFDLLMEISYKDGYFESFELLIEPRLGEDKPYLLHFALSHGNATFSLNGASNDEPAKVFPFNYTRFGELLQDEFANDMTVMRVIIYLLGALRLENERTISFTFNEENTFNLAGINADVFLKAMATSAGFVGNNNSAEFLSFLGITAAQFRAIFSDFTVTVDFDKEFISSR
jgi:hypothetical protein